MIFLFDIILIHKMAVQSNNKSIFPFDIILIHKTAVQSNNETMQQGIMARFISFYI